MILYTNYIALAFDPLSPIFDDRWDLIGAPELIYWRAGMQGAQENMQAPIDASSLSTMQSNNSLF